MSELRLCGCRPTPLAHYLKALGVLRLLSEQRDPQSRGAWDEGGFVLHTSLEAQELVEFFLHEYAPTPITSPWNGSSGYYKEGSKPALALGAILESTCERFADYRQVLSIAQEIVSRLGLEQQPDTKGARGGDKGRVLELCRSLFPDAALPWLDASYLMTADGPKFPPLLGTGGNDGRLEFSQNAIQRLLELIEPATGAPTPMAEAWLRGALFGEPVCGLLAKAAIGQFHPGAAGGFNMSQGFDANSSINPWDYVLMLEGALLFAASASRRWRVQGSAGTLAYPFTVRSSGVGYGSASLADEEASRAEIWMPLWQAPASVQELQALFAEGRVKDRRRPLQNGVDFALGVARLGIDRGLTGFQRFGFHERNGLAYFAVPLGAYKVPSRPCAKQIAEIEPWVDRFRRSTRDKHTPASMLRMRRQIDAAIMAVCQRDDAPNTLQLLLQLGACERLLARRTGWVVEQKIAPLPSLSCAWWEKLSSSTADALPLRMARSLASTYGAYRWGPQKPAQWWPLRAFLEPIGSATGPQNWWDDSRKPLLPLLEGDLYQILARLFAARVLRASALPQTQGELPRRPPAILERAVLWTSAGDLSAFLQRRLGYDEQKLFVDALWGFSLLDWRAIGAQTSAPREVPRPFSPGALYALLKLSYAGRFTVRRRGQAGVVDAEYDIPLHPGIFHHAQAGDGQRAGTLAIRRLRGSGLVPLLSDASALAAPPEYILRNAAAVGFVTSPQMLSVLAHSLCRLPFVESEPHPVPSNDAQMNPLPTDSLEDNDHEI